MNSAFNEDRVWHNKKMKTFQVLENSLLNEQVVQEWIKYVCAVNDQALSLSVAHGLIKGSVEWSRHKRHFCSLLPYFLQYWFQIFQLCLSFWTSSFDMVLLKNSFRKKKNIRKTSQNALASSIFIVWSIVLKLGTPLLHIQAQNTLLQIFNFALEVEIWTKNLQKRCFTLPGRLWRSITFFVGWN